MLLSDKIEIHNAAPPAPPPFSPRHQLPPKPAVFTGREEELTDLLQAIESGAAKGAAIAGKQAGLHGMGGVGKTALALVLAHRLKDRFPDAQLYLNLRGADSERRPPLPAAEVMERVIHTFHPQAKLPEDPEQLGATYRAVLTEAGRVLLLLDNAAGPDQIHPLLPPNNCLLLVTSRTQFAPAGWVVRNLDCLTPEKAQELLRTLAPRIADFAAEAAKLCGGLPLALEVFGAAVRENTVWPVADLVARLRAKNKDTLEPVRAAFQISYDLLAPSAQTDWRTLAVFPGSFDEAAAAAVWQAADPDSARHRLQALVKASLVEYNPGNARFRLHDLVREYLARLLAPEERRETRIRFGGHFARVGWQADRLYKSGGRKIVDALALFDLERANFETAFTLLSEDANWLIAGTPSLNATIAALAPSDSTHLLITLVDSLAHVVKLRFHSKEHLIWLNFQLVASQIVGDRAAEGRASGNMGLAYSELGQVRRAMNYYEAALVIGQEIDSRQTQGAVRSNLGNAYRALGEARKAIEYHELALMIRQEIGDRRGEAADVCGLGNAYFDLGEVRKAVDYNNAALIIFREIGDRRGEGAVLCNLGNAHRLLGKVRGSFDLHNAALVISRQIGDRRGEGADLAGLGNVYRTLGEVRKAIVHYEAALAIRREIGDRRGEGTDLGNLGNMYRNLGQVRKATEYYQSALVIAREIGDRRGEGHDLSNLGSIYLEMGDVHQAIANNETALTISKEIGNRYGEAVACFNLALAWFQLKDFDRAIGLARDALSIFGAIESPHADKVREKLAEWGASKEICQANPLVD